MTKTKEEVLEALAFLFAFSQDETYQAHLTTLMQYQTDVINMLTEVVEAAKEVEEKE